ncbi:DUF3558 domain-containing protein [Amycolatopsis australiensis]|uniref:DUF3558 domain-containing protein n=1 Tax=Amycolatopsis australiensis TaxID=546364 RepID=A0A1K1SC06_9PSEU|nr:DUF3558 domain-containing protein [Amycolatopsis australiensis]SFW81762.1 Protein of unknown function [Amycolatopsis australiensis]
MTRNGRAAGLLTAAAACLLASACTGTTTGSALPASSESAPAASSSAQADPDVPKVEATPLDAGKYATDPCGLVPGDVLTPLRYTDPGKYVPRGNTLDTEAGPSCRWTIHGEGIGLQMIVGTGNRDRGAGGLAGYYAGYRAGTLIKFLERAPDIEGYPAIYVDISDRRANGNCAIAVGVADDLAIGVQAEGYQGQDDSCGAATQAAAAAIKTLKGA